MADIATKWQAHLRLKSRRSKNEVRCAWCPHSADNAPSANLSRPEFEKHIADSHPELLDGQTTEAEKAAWFQSQWEAAQLPGDRDGDQKPGASSPTEANPRLPRTVAAGEGEQPYSPRPSNRRAPPVGPTRPAVGPEDSPSKSPTPSLKRGGGSRSRSPSRSRSRSASPPKRSKARQTVDDFDRGVYQKGKLWTPDDDQSAARQRPFDKHNVASQRQRPSSGSLSKTHRPPHNTLPSRAPAPAPTVDHDPTQIIKQPETRPISQEQLVAEVKGIYAGLVMVESKCIEVDNNQSSQNDPANKLNNDQWQALIALHRTLLHEHHDFFLASQHPSASPALRRLAAKYAMPARMWRHGIHSFLELLRHRLPASLDHMLTFIYMAYSMMALLYETVPAFEDTWIECLGDLGRYRMAIEDDDIRDREVWTAVSRHWYSRASDKAPTTGRLYHHLAILARPNALQQLYYYTKSLCVEIPFVSARESIMTLFEPLMSRTTNPQQARLPLPELSFAKTHGILFSGKQDEELEATMNKFFGLLDNHIARSTRRWLEPGYHIGIANICALTSYGSENNPITQALKTARPHQEIYPTGAESQDQPMPEATTSGATASSRTAVASSAATATTTKHFPDSLHLFTRTYDIVARRFGDPNILPFLHVTLAFIHHLTFCPDAMKHVAPHFPWKLTALMLNTLIGSSLSSPASSSASIPASASIVAITAAAAAVPLAAAASASAPNNVSSSSQGLARLFESATFPGWSKEVDKKDQGQEGAAAAAEDKEKTQTGTQPPVAPGPGAPKRRPLPEDFAQRGLPWVERYFPDGWFVTEERIDDDDKYFEVPSMTEERRERVIWLGCRIAEGGHWLHFDRESKRFSVPEKYDVELNLVEVPVPTLPATPGESVEYGELPDAGTVA